MPKERLIRVYLQEPEVDRLHILAEDETTCNTIRKRCLILLYADESGGLVRSRQEIAELAGVSLAAVMNTVKQYALHGIDDVLSIHRHINSDIGSTKVDVRIQRALTDLLAREPPEGTKHWSLRLLSKQLEIETGVRLGASTIGRTLQKLKESEP